MMSRKNAKKTSLASAPSLDLGDAEWKFPMSSSNRRKKGDPVEGDLHCYIWELLREIGNEQSDPRHQACDLLFKAANSDIFHKLCVQRDNIPSRLLTWIIAEGKWPEGPWTELDRSTQEAIRSFKALPPLIPFFVNKSCDFSEDITRLVVTQQLARKSHNEQALEIPATSPLDKMETREAMLVSLASSQGASAPIFVNWMQYRKRDLILAFKSLLDKSPHFAEQASSGSRIDPDCWLRQLAAHRLLHSCRSKDDIKGAEEHFRRHYGEFSTQGLKVHAKQAPVRAANIFPGIDPLLFR